METPTPSPYVAPTQIVELSEEQLALLASALGCKTVIVIATDQTIPCGHATNSCPGHMFSIQANVDKQYAMALLTLLVKKFNHDSR